MNADVVVRLEQYADLELAAEDARRLTELGFHPVIRAHDNLAGELTVEVPLPKGNVVLCVPSTESAGALLVLQAVIEAQADPREAGYE